MAMSAWLLAKSECILNDNGMSRIRALREILSALGTEVREAGLLPARIISLTLTEVGLEAESLQLKRWGAVGRGNGLRE